MIKMQLKNIKKSYGVVDVLNGINLDIKDGEFVVLIGSSGCGKSTLLRIICGLEELTSGQILVDGQDISTLPPQKRNMAMVFQSYALYPHMTVFNNIAYSLKISKKFTKDTIASKVEKVAKILDIDLLLKRYPKELSGGQRQRVAMGRSIVRNPDFYLFDEPLSNLDAKLRIVMRKEIKSLQQKLKTTTIYVTHDQIEAMTMADKVVLMHEGNIAQQGSPKEIFDKPNSIYVAKFLGSPTISIIEGVAKTSGEDMVCHTKDGSELLLKKLKNLKDKQKIKLGIRANNIKLATKRNKNTFSAEVTMSEYTGSMTVIYAKFSGSEIKILVPSNKNIKNGDKVLLTYDLEQSNIFDAKTELRID